MKKYYFFFGSLENSRIFVLSITIKAGGNRVNTAKTKMATVKVIGNVTHSTTQEFQRATFLNDANAACEIFNELFIEGWYPQNSDAAWTDIAVLDGRYYAAFGEDSVTAQNAKLIYVEIEPSASMIREYDYFKQ